MTAKDETGTRQRASHTRPAQQADGAVLFVHGIGRQCRGATLDEWSPRLREFLTLLGERNARRGNDDLLRDLLCEPWPGDGEARAERWILRTGDGKTQSWLVTESWWAEAFEAPAPATFIRWCFLVFPRFVLYQLTAAYIGHWYVIADDLNGVPGSAGTPGSRPHPVRARLRMIALGPAMLVSAALRFVALTLMLAAVLVAGLLYRLGRNGPMNWLIAYLGDSLAAVVDDGTASGSRGAMLRTITSDIDRCLEATHAGGEVIVVAHSQGAMLARQALADHERDERLNLRTVGAGIGPLSALSGASRLAVAAGSWAMLAVLMTSAAASIVALARVADYFYRSMFRGRWDYEPDPATILGDLILVVLVCFALAAVLVLVTDTRQIFPRLNNLSLDGVVDGWRELSCVHDPVSCGPLLDRRAARAHVVGNGFSIFTQHTTYSRNRYVHFHITNLIPGAFNPRTLDEEGEAALEWSSIRVRALRAQAFLLLALGAALLGGATLAVL